MATDALVDLINSIKRPSLVANIKNKILVCNKAFAETFGNKEGLDLIDVFGNERESISISKMLTNEKFGWVAQELPLPTLKGSKLFWMEIYTTEDRLGQARRVLTMHNMTLYRQMEAAYLSRMRHVADENLWILNKETFLIWAKTNSPVLNAYIGLSAAELVYPDDRELWEKAVAKAKKKPGTEVSCTVRGSADKEAKIINICYFLGGLFDGRFYVTSRSSNPLGRRIILRMRDAWQVASTAELAEKLQTTGGAISKAANSASVPPVWLTQTADSTGASLDWLCYGQGKKWRNEKVYNTDE